MDSDSGARLNIQSLAVHLFTRNQDEKCVVQNGSEYWIIKLGIADVRKNNMKSTITGKLTIVLYLLSIFWIFS